MTSRRTPRYQVRSSPIHGRGVFARVALRSGARIGEYRGRRIDRAEMERLWAAREAEGRHTFFFTLDEERVIDAGVGGNGIRFINHSCAPNCVTVEVDGRVFVEALRDLRPGEELAYDYLLQPGDGDDPFVDYGCACGARRCRGTMVDPALLPRRRLSAGAARPRPAGPAPRDRAGAPR